MLAAPRAALATTHALCSPPAPPPLPPPPTPSPLLLAPPSLPLRPAPPLPASTPAPPPLPRVAVAARAAAATPALLLYLRHPLLRVMFATGDPPCLPLAPSVHVARRSAHAIPGWERVLRPCASRPPRAYGGPSVFAHMAVMEVMIISKAGGCCMCRIQIQLICSYYGVLSEPTKQRGGGNGTSTRQYTAGTRQYRAVRTGLGWLCTVTDWGVTLQQLQSYIPLRIGMYSSRSFLMSWSNSRR
jgi:hypothetical protein